MKALLFLVKHKSAFFHPRCGEKGYVSGPRKLLGRFASRIRMWSGEIRDGDYHIKVIGDERFIGNDEAQ
jgi:hypothetical protein